MLPLKMFFTPVYVIAKKSNNQSLVKIIALLFL